MSTRKTNPLNQSPREFHFPTRKSLFLTRKSLFLTGISLLTRESHYVNEKDEPPQSIFTRISLSHEKVTLSHEKVTLPHGKVDWLAVMNFVDDPRKTLNCWAFYPIV